MAFLPRRHRGGFIKLTVFVFIASGVMAAFFGLVASIHYSQFPLEPVVFLHHLGLGWGAITGLIAAAFWCRKIFRRIDCGQVSRLALHGAGWGVIAGLISTLLLHAVLFIFGTHRELIGILVGLPIGLVAGLILGGVSGMICQAVVNAKPAEQPAAPDALPPTEP